MVESSCPGHTHNPNHLGPVCLWQELEGEGREYLCWQLAPSELGLFEPSHFPLLYPGGSHFQVPFSHPTPLSPCPAPPAEGALGPQLTPDPLPWAGQGVQGAV